MTIPPRPEDAVKLNTIICGDALEVLRGMPAESVNCCVTSPPYWGLRDYGVPGQLGLEKTPEEYTAKMVELFEEVRRVLRKDGVMFLNLGDSYARDAAKGQHRPGDSGKQGYIYDRGGGRASACLKLNGKDGRQPCEEEHALPYDTSCKVPQGCPLRGSIWTRPCDGCRAASVLRSFHSDPSPSCGSHDGSRGPIQAHKGFEHDHLPTSDSLNQTQIHQSSFAMLDQKQTPTPSAGLLPSIPESMPDVSSRQSLGECLPMGASSFSQDGDGEKIHDGNQSAHKAACISGIEGNSSSSVDRNNIDYSACPYRYSATPYRLKSKDLCGIPWRIAFALQAAGWWLRQDIVWSKDNPMPESVRDRCCKSHEYVFLLSKSERYFFNLDAILEPCESSPSDIRKMVESQERIGGKHKILDDPLSKASAATNIGRKRSVGGKRSGNIERKYGEAVNRNGSHMGRSVPWEGLVRTPRSVWRINTEPCREAHFAVMPTRLVERCILAGCPEGGVVVDTFFGSGTVGVVARKLNRNFIGIELNPKYIEIAERRIEREVGLLLDMEAQL